jgi:hypothetical protein
MRKMPGDPIDYFEHTAPHSYKVTILRNTSPHDLSISIATMAAGESSFENEETDLNWPLGIYSLSHIAIPFPSIDPLYGDGKSAGANDAGVVLGAIAPRGELGLLLLSSDYFLRTRYNPFYSFQSRYTTEWLLADK